MTLEKQIGDQFARLTSGMDQVAAKGAAKLADGVMRGYGVLSRHEFQFTMAQMVEKLTLAQVAGSCAELMKMSAKAVTMSIEVVRSEEPDTDFSDAAKARAFDGLVAALGTTRKCFETVAKKFEDLTKG